MSASLSLLLEYTSIPNATFALSLQTEEKRVLLARCLLQLDLHDKELKFETDAKEDILITDRLYRILDKGTSFAAIEVITLYNGWCKKSSDDEERAPVFILHIAGLLPGRPSLTSWMKYSSITGRTLVGKGAFVNQTQKFETNVYLNLFFVLHRNGMEFRSPLCCSFMNAELVKVAAAESGEAYSGLVPFPVPVFMSGNKKCHVLLPARFPVDTKLADELSKWPLTFERFGDGKIALQYLSSELVEECDFKHTSQGLEGGRWRNEKRLKEGWRDNLKSAVTEEVFRMVEGEGDTVRTWRDLCDVMRLPRMLGVK